MRRGENKTASSGNRYKMKSFVSGRGRERHKGEEVCFLVMELADGHALYEGVSETAQFITATPGLVSDEDMSLNEERESTRHAGLIHQLASQLKTSCTHFCCIVLYL